DFQQQVYLHRRAPSPVTEKLDIPWTTTTEYRLVLLSRDARHVVAIEKMQNPIPVAIARLDGEGPLQWQPFVTSLAHTLAGHVLGDHYFAVTDAGAPRGRLVAIPLTTDRPCDPDCWQEIVPESHAVLRTLTSVGDALYLTEFVDTYARVRIVG